MWVDAMVLTGIEDISNRSVDGREQDRHSKADSCGLDRTQYTHIIHLTGSAAHRVYPQE